MMKEMRANPALHSLTDSQREEVVYMRVMLCYGHISKLRLLGTLDRIKLLFLFKEIRCCNTELQSCCVIFSSHATIIKLKMGFTTQWCQIDENGYLRIYRHCFQHFLYEILFMNSLNMLWVVDPPSPLWTPFRVKTLSLSFSPHYLFFENVMYVIFYPTG